MGSPSHRVVRGKYTGNASATPREFVVGFKPQKLVVRSVVGEVVFQESMPGAWKQVHSAVPSYRPAGEVEFKELKFVIASTDTGLNGASTEYHYEASE